MTDEEKKRKEQEEFDKLFDELFKNDNPKAAPQQTPIKDNTKKNDEVFDDDFLKSLFDDEKKEIQIQKSQIAEQPTPPQEIKKEEDNFDWLKELIDEIDKEEQEKKKKEQQVPSIPAKPVKPSFTSKLKDKPRSPKPPEHIRMWGSGKKLVKIPVRERNDNAVSTRSFKDILMYLSVALSISLVGFGIYHHFDMMHSTELCMHTDIIMRKAYSGDKILIDTSVVNESGKRVIEQGYIDAQISNIMYHYLKTGDKVIDIGAGFGYHTLYLARIVGETGKVFSFEARSAMYNLLDSSVLINKLNNVQTFNTLLFSENTKVMIDTNDYHKKSNFGVTNIVLQQDNIYSKESTHEVINAMTIDSVLHDVSNISMMHINANGYELSIILGAKNIIAASPQIKIITTWSKYQMAKYVNVQTVVQNLLDNDFKFWLLKPSNGKLIPLSQLEHIMQVERGRFVIARSLD